MDITVWSPWTVDSFRVIFKALKVLKNFMKKFSKLIEPEFSLKWLDDSASYQNMVDCTSA